MRIFLNQKFFAPKNTTKKSQRRKSRSAPWQLAGCTLLQHCAPAQWGDMKGCPCSIRRFSCGTAWQGAHTPPTRKPLQPPPWALPLSHPGGMRGRARSLDGAAAASPSAAVVRHEKGGSECPNQKNLAPQPNRDWLNATRALRSGCL